LFLSIEHCLFNAVCSHLRGDEKLATAAPAAPVEDDGLLAPHCEETAKYDPLTKRTITGENTAAVAALQR